MRKVPGYLACVFDVEWGSRIQLGSWMIPNPLPHWERGRVVAEPMLLEPQYRLLSGRLGPLFPGSCFESLNMGCFGRGEMVG